jgi:hypothetical protein
MELNNVKKTRPRTNLGLISYVFNLMMQCRKPATLPDLVAHYPLFIIAGAAIDRAVILG